jgi:hypothetical protein
METAKEKSRAARKQLGDGGIKFEAEATGHLQKEAIPV